MSFSSPTLRGQSSRPRARPRVPLDFSDLDALAAESHRLDVQWLIRDGIRRGVVRVVPLAGSPGRVRVVRVTLGPAPGA